MRILVITNLYPPLYLGGYELKCRLHVEELKRRGHDVLVLTSRWRVEAPLQQEGVPVSYTHLTLPTNREV